MREVILHRQPILTAWGKEGTKGGGVHLRFIERRHSFKVYVNVEK
jgi:hypothetical protein